MAFDIVIGRGAKDREEHGTTGTVLLGKHYVKMGQVTALSQPVNLDLNKAHVVFVAGKRGSGKSYSMGVIAEGIATLPDEIRKKLSVILLDTMGVYWTMKYPNHKDEQLLNEWGMEGKGIPIVIYTPIGYYDKAKAQGIPTDYPFAIKPSELGPEDWFLSFDLAPNDPIAVYIERIVLTLKDKKDDYDIQDVIDYIKEDEKEDVHIRNAAENRFVAAQRWGLFSKQATPVKDLAAPGQVTILDMSAYAVMPDGWRIKNLAIGLVAQKIFVERMIARKEEEYHGISSAVHYLREEAKTGSEMPIVWLMLDEAHEFLPKEGKTAATQALITLLREGRQPGIAMVLATQQPGKIHTDAMTQSDIILAHRLTAKLDTDALGALLQNYLRANLIKELDILPRVAGACLAIDDVNERMYPMRIRPRSSWHGGAAPGVIQKKKKIFEFE
jgi:DNA helicase HerA-like ATPase